MPRAETSHRPLFTPRLILGLAVMLLGTALFLDNLDWIDLDQYFHFWPMLLIALGVLKIWSARSGFGRWVGMLLTVAGGWLLLYELGYVRMDLTRLWPLALVLFGVHLVFRSRSERRSQGPPAVDSAAEIYELAVLGGAGRVSNAPEFRGGEMVAFMGGGTLDLTQAEIVGESAVIDVYAVWGGFEILVPSHWSVTCKGMMFLGGFVDSTRQPKGAPGPRLIVQGLAVMGGVDIKNPPAAPAPVELAARPTKAAPAGTGE
jgi:predicted membrane protein